MKRLSQEEPSEEIETAVGLPVAKKKTIAEKKLDLLSKCTEAITSNSKKVSEVSNTKKSAFSMYVEERLCQLSNRNRRIAEKRISDVIFDIKMSAEREETLNNQPMVYGNFNNNTYMNMTPPMAGQTYMDMLNKQ